VSFQSFIGVDLGGGKGKTTAVAHLRMVSPADGSSDDPARVEVVDYGTGKEAPFHDDRLLAYLREHDDAIIAIDAPLSLPSCLREPEAPGIARWFEERAAARGVVNGRKPLYTPYTQRVTEVLLAEVHEILPRETLGQGMGPLTARGVYLRRALAPRFELGRNLIEVYPKATLIQLVGRDLARGYKRSARERNVRLAILNRLPELRFGQGQWREHALDSDHKFDAVICAYTAYLFSRGACIAPTDAERELAADGWIWIPQPQAT
jgi:predicted nuclease with RNAse H fold